MARTLKSGSCGWLCLSHPGLNLFLIMAFVFLSCRETGGHVDGGPTKASRALYLY